MIYAPHPWACTIVGKTAAVFSNNMGRCPDMYISVQLTLYTGVRVTV